VLMTVDAWGLLLPDRRCWLCLRGCWWWWMCLRWWRWLCVLGGDGSSINSRWWLALW